MAFRLCAGVCVCVCAHTNSAPSWTGLEGKPRGEVQGKSKNAKSKPLAAVAQSSGFLCRFRKTVSGVSRKRFGILSRVQPTGPQALRAGTGPPAQNNLQTAALQLNLSGPCFYKRTFTEASVSFTRLASDMRHFYCNCRVMLSGSSCFWQKTEGRMTPPPYTLQSDQLSRTGL